INRAGPEVVTPFIVSETTKPDPPLKTIPVGVPPVGLPSGEGILTPWDGFMVRGIFAPVPVYKVETPALLSETQKGLVGPYAKRQGLSRLGSGGFAGATPGMLDTKFVCKTDTLDNKRRSSRLSSARWTPPERRLSACFGKALAIIGNRFLIVASLKEKGMRV